MDTKSGHHLQGRRAGTFNQFKTENESTSRIKPATPLQFASKNNSRATFKDTSLAKSMQEPSIGPENRACKVPSSFHKIPSQPAL
ncbi:hypothetical protein V6N11_024845 [Hibiscus sabdariffa]|uniref:Uncharacterized protein n=1 Tax=Hibiscus sabdariffa TaxID=183260 RepID=A0ABR2QNB6_9ROSI